MPTEPPSPSRPEHRIAKLLARAGVASRREIERMIADGRVALDGRVLDTPATLLASLRGVTVDGQPVEAPAPARLFLYHKPPGLLVTERDPAGRPTIYDRLPSDLPRVVPVGRLDLATEGLLLLTTDGGLKRSLELPATGVERAYRARAYGEISQARLEELIEGIEIDGIRYGPIDANLERRTGANVWIELVLTEGKNREVRNVLDHLGLQVSRLIRTRYGPFILGDLPPGGVGEVRQHDLVAFTRSLKDGGKTDVRVAGERRTTSRTTREPDAPRRARAHAGQPRPLSATEPPDAAATPRQGFRTPKSSDANTTRAARFAATRESTGDLRATRGAAPERPGRNGPRATTPARAARPDARAGTAGGWPDRSSPGDRPRRAGNAEPARGAPRNGRAQDSLSATRTDTARDGARGKRPGQSRNTLPGGRAERSDRPARSDAPERAHGTTRDDRPQRTARAAPTSRSPRSDSPAPARGGTPRSGTSETPRGAPPRDGRTDKTRTDRSDAPRGGRPGTPRGGKPGSPRRPGGKR